MTPANPEVQARIRIIRDTSKYFSVHTHSRYSAQDAFPAPAAIVKRAKELGYRGLALTDHGNMAGSIELYQECQKVGIKPFPGSEMYLIQDRERAKAAKNKGPDAKRYHLCLLAYTSQGYRNMVRISTYSHENFYGKPVIDMKDLARFHEWGWSEGVALTTGCYFGLVIQTLVNTGYEAAKQIVASYASWFDSYVELQCHNIEGQQDEQWVANSLVQIADDLGLPVVITQDSHYLHAGEQELHNEFKRLVSFGAGTDDVVFPGDGYHLVDDAWMRRHHGDDHFARGIQGLDRLLSRHDLRIPEADSYHYRIPSVSADPDTEIRRRCFAALAGRKLLSQRYLDRMEEELEVIEVSRMGNYIMLVTQVCDYMRKTHVFFQTRGSAAGSLVCWLMGITNIDPIRWKARFDRFLTKDRKKPPDIDLDIESARRDEVVSWLKSRYAVAPISTWGVLGMDPDEDGKGSLKVKYFSKRRAVMKANGEIPKPDDWSTVPVADKQAMYALAKKESYANYGTHACGMALLNSRTELEELLPLAWNANSKMLVTQFDAKTVEKIGVVKLDALGLHLMSTMRICCDNLGKSTTYLETIPTDDKRVYASISDGNTTGVFQLEGKTVARGCRELRPRRIEEVIDSVALFRPATMSSGATADYIDRKFGRAVSPVRHQVIQANTVDTRGVLLYQDQIIAIIRDLGFGAEDVSRILGAVKASNKNVEAAAVELAHYMPQIESRARAAGFTDADWSWMGSAFRAFAEYSFNIPHSTVYGLCAYRSAWLAINHPIEYHAAMLSVATGTDREAKYLSTTKGRRIKVDSPKLNESGLGYTISSDRKRILRGFLSIDGIGISIARSIIKGQPYRDWEDFVTKSIGTRISGLREFHPEQTSADQLIGTVKILYDLGMLRVIGNPPLGTGYVKRTRKKKEVAA